MNGTEVDDARFSSLSALVEEGLEVVETHWFVWIIGLTVADADGADLSRVTSVLVQVLDVTRDGGGDINIGLSWDVRLIE